VIVDDAWELDAWTGSAPEPETTVRMLLAGDVALTDGAARITPLEGARPVVVRWPSEIRARTSARELDDPLLASVWGSRLTRIDLVVTDRRALSVAVELFTSTPEESR
jgi:hypothetical protein